MFGTRSVWLWFVRVSMGMRGFKYKRSHFTFESYLLIQLHRRNFARWQTGDQKEKERSLLVWALRSISLLWLYRFPEYTNLLLARSLACSYVAEFVQCKWWQALKIWIMYRRHWRRCRVIVEFGAHRIRYKISDSEWTSCCLFNGIQSIIHIFFVCAFEIFFFAPKSVRMSYRRLVCVCVRTHCLFVSSSCTAECHESITNHLFIQSTLFRCRRMHTRFTRIAAEAAASRAPYRGPRSARHSNTYHLWKMICENSTSNKSFLFHCRIQFPHSTLAHTSLFYVVSLFFWCDAGSARDAPRNTIAVIQFIFKIIYEIFFPIRH